MSPSNIIPANKYKTSKLAELKQQNYEINKNSRKQQGTHKNSHKNGTKRASDAEVSNITGCQKRKQNANKGEGGGQG